METTESTKITHEGYEFDGDSEGLEFIKKLNRNEINSLIKVGVYYGSGSTHYMQDDKENHLKVTKTGNIYMVSKA